MIRPPGPPLPRWKAPADAHPQDRRGFGVRSSGSGSGVELSIRDLRYDMVRRAQHVRVACVATSGIASHRRSVTRDGQAAEPGTSRGWIGREQSSAGRTEVPRTVVKWIVGQAKTAGQARARRRVEPASYRQSLAVAAARTCQGGKGVTQNDGSCFTSGCSRILT